MKEIKIYVAEDGTQFETKEECAEHEDKLKKLELLSEQTICGLCNEYYYEISEFKKCSEMPIYDNSNELNFIKKFNYAMDKYNFIYIPKGLSHFLEDFCDSLEWAFPKIDDEIIYFDEEEDEWLPLSEKIETETKKLEKLKDMYSLFLSNLTK